MSERYEPPRSELADHSAPNGSGIVAVVVGFAITLVVGVGAAVAIAFAHGALNPSSTDPFVLANEPARLCTHVLAAFVVSWLAAHWVSTIANHREYLWVSIVLMLSFAFGELTHHFLPALRDFSPAWYVAVTWVAVIVAGFSAAYVFRPRKRRSNGRHVVRQALSSK